MLAGRTPTSGESRSPCAELRFRFHLAPSHPFTSLTTHTSILSIVPACDSTLHHSQSLYRHASRLLQRPRHAIAATLLADASQGWPLHRQTDGAFVHEPQPMTADSRPPPRAASWLAPPGGAAPPVPPGHTTSTSVRRAPNTRSSFLSSLLRLTRAAAATAAVLHHIQVTPFTRQQWFCLYQPTLALGGGPTPPTTTHHQL